MTKKELPTREYLSRHTGRKGPSWDTPTIPCPADAGLKMELEKMRDLKRYRATEGMNSRPWA